MNQAVSKCQIKLDPNIVILDKILVKSNFTDKMAESFGQWLAQKRKDAGLTQTELAQRSRVTKATISLYEKDKVSQPRLRQLDKIGKALNIPSQEIRNAANSALIKKPTNLAELIDASSASNLDNLDNPDIYCGQKTATLSCGWHLPRPVRLSRDFCFLYLGHFLLKHSKPLLHCLYQGNDVVALSPPRDKFPFRSIYFYCFIHNITDTLKFPY